MEGEKDEGREEREEDEDREDEEKEEKEEEEEKEKEEVREEGEAAAAEDGKHSELDVQKVALELVETYSCCVRGLGAGGGGRVCVRAEERGVGRECG